MTSPNIRMWSEHLAFINISTFCPSWPVIKIGSFSSCMRNAKCLHALLAWSENQILSRTWLCIWLTCWNCYQSWPRSHQQILFFSDQKSCHIFVINMDSFNSFQILCTVLRLPSKHDEIVLELPVWMSCSTAYHLQISEGGNCIMVLVSSQTVLNWLLVAAQKTKPETNKVHA